MSVDKTKLPLAEIELRNLYIFELKTYMKDDSLLGLNYLQGQICD